MSAHSRRGDGPRLEGLSGLSLGCRRYDLGLAVFLAWIWAAPAGATGDGGRTADLIFNLSGAAFCLGFAVLHGLIYAFHPRERANFWFALFAFALAANGGFDAALTGGDFGAGVQAALYQATFLSAIVMLVAVVKFLAALGGATSRSGLRWLLWGLVPTVVVLFVPQLTRLREPVFSCWALWAAALGGLSALGAWRRRVVGARMLSVSAGGLGLTILGEVGKLSGVLGQQGEFLFHGTGLLLVLLGASLVLARRIASAGTELEQLAANLELRVADRTAALLQSERAALAASRAKSAFLATMSHEIRTPMSAIVGLSQLLASGPLGRRERGMAATIQASALALLKLIDEVLDLARIEAGQRPQVDASPFAPRELVQDVGDLFAAKSRLVGVALTWSVGAEVPGCLRGDSGRLRQVLSNLVGNGLKFTERGKVEIRAGYRGGSLLLEVADTGVGIAADALETIFDAFTQADSTTTRRFGGAGLGLTISRELVAAMGGTIMVESQLGHGSTFRVVVPAEAVGGVVPADSGATSARSASAGSPESGPLRVLVAEDDEANQFVTSLMLERLGHVAVVVGTGTGALQALADGSFDVALLDLHMPELDGISLAGEIRRRGDPTLLVAVTASVLEDDRDRCKAAGMDGFLPKPVTLEGLRDALDRVGARPARTGAG